MRTLPIWHVNPTLARGSPPISGGIKTITVGANGYPSVSQGDIRDFPPAVAVGFFDTSLHIHIFSVSPRKYLPLNYLVFYPY